MKQQFFTTKRLVLLVVAFFIAAFSVTGCNLQELGQKPEQKGTLTIGVTPWTTTIPPSHIVKIILEEELGYDVKMNQADVGVVYSGLATGDIDIFLDAWLPDMHRDYMNRFGDEIDDVAISYTEGVLGWAVPTYVEPDSITELNNYASRFDTDGNGKGEIVGIDAGAGMMRTSAEMIAAYDLNYELIEGSEFAMVSALKKAVRAKDWIIILGWRPHWMFTEFDLKFLEDPKDFWKSSEVHTLATKGLDERAPEAYRFLQEWNLPVEDLEEMIKRLEIDEVEPETLAREYIKQNRDRIDAMLTRAQE